MGMLDFILRRPPVKSPRDEKKNVNKPDPTNLYAQGGVAVKMFEDLPTLQKAQAYKILYEHDTVVIPAQKLAQKCGAFRSSIVGGGETGEFMQEVVNQSMGLQAAQEYLYYAVIEGVRFLWKRARPAGKINVLDARDCGGQKVRAGGHYWWDGYDGGNVIRFQPLAGWSATKEAVDVDRDRVLVFKPSVDANPEGDTKLAQNLLRVAHLSALLDVAEQVYTERHSLPKEIIKRVMDDLDPASVASAITVGLSKLQGAHALKNWSMERKEALELIEASGRTWQFLESLRSSLNARGHKLLTGENLTSDSTGSGDSGSSEQADNQLFSRAAYAMALMGESFTNEMLPFLLEVNKHRAPPLKLKDEPMRWVFRAPVEKQRLKPAELYGAWDRGYPTEYGFCAAVLGTDVPPGKNPRDLFYRVGMSPEDQAKKQELAEQQTKEMMPSSTGGAEQRKDREVPGSDMPPDDKQDKQTDKRNMDKE